MFDLGKSIEQWRKEMRRAGITNAALEELEGHLREKARTEIERGAREQSAFEVAVAQLGNADAVRSEFEKIGSGRNWPLRIGILVILFLAVAEVWQWAWSPRFGVSHPLLFAHVSTITVGYECALLAGMIGCASAFGGRETQKKFRQTITLFTLSAAGIATTGFFLGAIWTTKYFGSYLGWSPKEIGGLATCAWLLFAAWLQTWNGVTDQIIIRLAMVGNFVICLGWLAPFLFIPNRSGTHAWISLMSALAVNAGLFAIAETKRRRAEAH
jgi:hypothetical protein